MNSGIYKITCKTTGKFYIGSSSQIKRRWMVHKCYLKGGIYGNGYLQRAYDKYGIDDFVFEIVQNVDNKEDLFKIEQEWLDKTKSYDPSIGYNLSKNAECVGGKSKVWIVTDPKGIEYVVENLYNFCAEACLKYKVLVNIADGHKTSSHKGYYCRRGDVSKEEWDNIRLEINSKKSENIYKIFFPDGTGVVVIDIPKFCQENNICSDKVKDLLSGKIKELDGSQSEKIISMDFKKYIKYIITTPDGTIIETKDLKRFCNENNLINSNMYKLAYGVGKQHKGFKCTKVVDESIVVEPRIKKGRKRPGFIVTTPTGKEIEVHNLQKFCREHNLTARCLHAVANGKGWSNKGYTCRKIGNPPRIRPTKEKKVNNE